MHNTELYAGSWGCGPYVSEMSGLHKAGERDMAHLRNTVDHNLEVCIMACPHLTTPKGHGDEWCTKFGRPADCKGCDRAKAKRARMMEVYGTPQKNTMADVTRQLKGLGSTWLEEQLRLQKILEEYATGQVHDEYIIPEDKWAEVKRALDADPMFGGNTESFRVSAARPNAAAGVSADSRYGRSFGPQAEGRLHRVPAKLGWWGRLKRAWREHFGPKRSVMEGIVLGETRQIFQALTVHHVCPDCVGGGDVTSWPSDVTVGNVKCNECQTEFFVDYAGRTAIRTDR